LVATFDAYSQDRYTSAAWVQIAARLITEGFSDAEVRWVMESKYTRWAADAANKPREATAADFANYVTSPHLGSFEKLHRVTQREVIPPATQDGAELAGNCEGEQIAALIDLVKLVAEGKARDPFYAAGLVTRAQALIAEIKGRAQ
jgi:hypothetical protein